MYKFLGRDGSSWVVGAAGSCWATRFCGVSWKSQACDRYVFLCVYLGLDLGCLDLWFVV